MQNSKEGVRGMQKLHASQYYKDMKERKSIDILSNGMQYILWNTHDDQFRGLVSIALTIRCGTMDSRLEKKETAHVLEHIMMGFDKDKKIRENYISIKACTNFRSTTYYMICVYDRLDVCLSLIASIYSKERINRLNRLIAIEEVIYEADLKYCDRKGEFCKNINLFKGSIFEDYMPNTKIENINNITLQDLKKFHDQWYSPTNSQLAMFFGGTQNELEFYRNKVLARFNKIEGNCTIQGRKDFRKYNICNNNVYIISDMFNIDRIIVLYEVKQRRDFIIEKIEMNLFYQCIYEIINEYFGKTEFKLYDFDILQFYNNSFLISFEFDYNRLECVKDKLDAFFDFLLDNYELINNNICRIKEEKMEVAVTSQELLNYLVEHYTYKQKVSYGTTEEFLDAVNHTIKLFSIDRMQKIIEQLKNSNKKYYIFRSGCNYDE